MKVESDKNIMTNINVQYSSNGVVTIHKLSSCNSDVLAVNEFDVALRHS